MISHSLKYLIIGLGDVLNLNDEESQNKRGSILISKLEELNDFYELNICLHGIKKMCINKKD